MCNFLMANNQSPAELTVEVTDGFKIHFDQPLRFLKKIIHLVLLLGFFVTASAEDLIVTSVDTKAELSDGNQFLMERGDYYPLVG